VLNDLASKARTSWKK